MRPRSPILWPKDRGRRRSGPSPALGELALERGDNPSFPVLNRRLQRIGAAPERGRAQSIWKCQPDDSSMTSHAPEARGSAPAAGSVEAKTRARSRRAWIVGFSWEERPRLPAEESSLGSERSAASHAPWYVTRREVGAPVNARKRHHPKARKSVNSDRTSGFLSIDQGLTPG